MSVCTSRFFAIVIKYNVVTITSQIFTLVFIAYRGWHFNSCANNVPEHGHVLIKYFTQNIVIQNAFIAKLF